MPTRSYVDESYLDESYLDERHEYWMAAVHVEMQHVDAERDRLCALRRHGQQRLHRSKTKKPGREHLFAAVRSVAHVVHMVTVTDVGRKE